MFKRNPHLIEEIRKMPGYHASAVSAGKAIQAAAEALSPPRIMRRSPRAFVTEATPDGARVTNTDYGAHIAEYGSVNNPAYAPLRRGTQAAGFELREPHE
jgi:hypothetical protein